MASGKITVEPTYPYRVSRPKGSDLRFSTVLFEHHNASLPELYAKAREDDAHLQTIREAAALMCADPPQTSPKSILTDLYAGRSRPQVVSSLAMYLVEQDVPLVALVECTTLPERDLVEEALQTFSSLQETGRWTINRTRLVNQVFTGVIERSNARALPLENAIVLPVNPTDTNYFGANMYARAFLGAYAIPYAEQAAARGDRTAVISLLSRSEVQAMQLQKQVEIRPITMTRSSINASSRTLDFPGRGSGRAVKRL